MKAGLLEIADVFVVNKADRDGAERMKSELVQMLHLRPASTWSIPVLLTQAAADVGIDEVLRAAEAHRALGNTDPERARVRCERRADELIDLLDEELRRRLAGGLDGGADGLRQVMDAVRGGTLDPYTAALRILNDARTLNALLMRSRE